MAPPTLYKYLRPDRIDVLTGGRIRFSQRTVFDDDHELAPDYAEFGTYPEMLRLVLSRPFKSDPRVPMNVLLEIIAHDRQLKSSQRESPYKM